jgi:predicted hydrolase (HD superfamily)
VAEQHAEWGAQLASQAGASAHTVELIRHHHDPHAQKEPLLAALQAADDKN